MKAIFYRYATMFATASALTGVRVAATAARPSARRAAVVVRAEEGGKIEKKVRGLPQPAAAAAAR